VSPSSKLQALSCSATRRGSAVLRGREESCSVARGAHGGVTAATSCHAQAEKTWERDPT
jgi:hypothetical protein